MTDRLEEHYITTSSCTREHMGDVRCIYSSRVAAQDEVVSWDEIDLSLTMADLCMVPLG